MLGSDHIVQISVQVFDKATDPIKKIVQQVKSMNADFKAVGTQMSAFNAKLDTSIKYIDKMANSMNKFNMYTSNIQRNLKLVAAVGIGTAAAVGVNSAKKAVDFEYTTTKMQTRMGSSDAVRKQIDDYILNGLTGKTQFKPTEIANLGVLLGQAGVNNLPDMKALLKSTTFFAESVDADAETAGKMIISAANGFGISMKDSGKITDKLTIALNDSMLEVGELPHAIGELAGRAKMLGQSMDSSLVALMTGSNQGMGAAQMSQDFLHGMTQLSLVGDQELMTPKRKKLYEKAGIDTSFFDTNKRQLKEYPDIIASLEKTLQNQGLMPNRENFYKAIADNGGQIPDGLIDKMKAMPLISKVFGASGQAPMLMGMQAKYDQVDPNSGKVTNTLYGSEALKAMEKDLQNSNGAVTKVHDKISETAKFQLAALSGEWEKAQIKISDTFLPMLKVATQTLTDYVGGKGAAGGLDRFNASVQQTADNLKKTNPMMGELVSLMGNVVVDSAKIGKAMVPTLDQVGNSTIKDVAKGDWGGPLWQLPFEVVKNGMNFIGDVTKSNPESDKAIAKLPPELQDKAKLTRDLVTGGVVLVAAGAIIKVLEMAFRAASLGLKGVKAISDIGTTIIKLMFGGDAKGALAGILGKNVTMQANIVNVYGKEINSPGSGGGKGGEPVTTPGGASEKVPSTTPKEEGLPPRSSRMKPKTTFDPLKFGEPGPPRPSAGVSDLFWPMLPLSILAQMSSDKSMKDDAAKKASIEKMYKDSGIDMPPNTSLNSINMGSGSFDPTIGTRTKPKMPFPTIGENINSITSMSFLDKFKSSSNDAITKGFSDVNKSLGNVKVDNNMNLQFSPTIVVQNPNGTSVVDQTPQISNDQISGLQNYMLDLSRRHGN